MQCSKYILYLEIAENLKTGIGRPKNVCFKQLIGCIQPFLGEIWTHAWGCQINNNNKIRKKGLFYITVSTVVCTK